MRWFVLIFSIIIFASSSHAILLSPPSYSFDFSPGVSHDCSFIVKNTNDYVTSFSLHVEGPLNESIKLSEYSATVQPNIWHPFSCSIKLPPDIAPGLSENKVVTMEGKQGSDNVGAVAGVGLLLNVRKPYPGKYLEADLQVADSEVDKPVLFRLLLTSRGSERVDSAKSTFYVYSPSGELLATLYSESVSIVPSATVELSAFWSYGKPGVYRVVADVSYDNSKVSAERYFKVGDFLIQIVKVSAPDTKIGSIAKVFVDVSSVWNSAIDSVFASLDVKDVNGAVVASSESPSFSLSPWESKSLTLYFDASNLKPSVYDLLVTLNYANRTSSASGSVKVVKPFPLVYVLVGVIVVMAVLFIFIFLRRGKRR